jgi:hypothetical protein
MEEATGLHDPRWEDLALPRVEWLGSMRNAQPRFERFIPELYAGFRHRYADALEPECTAIGGKIHAAARRLPSPNLASGITAMVIKGYLRLRRG